MNAMTRAQTSLFDRPSGRAVGSSLPHGCRGSISLLGDARVEKLADTSQMQHALVIVWAVRVCVDTQSSVQCYR